MSEHPIRMFDPRLGTLRGELTDASMPDGGAQSVELFHVELQPDGQVVLHLRPADRPDTGEMFALDRVDELTDGGLELTLSDGCKLQFAPDHAAGVRDLILSLANRTTPYF